MKTTKKALSPLRLRRTRKSRARLLDDSAVPKPVVLRKRGPAVASAAGTGRVRVTSAKPTLRLRRKPRSGRLVPPGNVDREVATLRKWRDRDDRATPSVGAARKTSLG